MKTFLQRLADEAREARTADGAVYIVRLLRPAEADVSEAYERLGRSVPLPLLTLPAVPTIEDLGSEAFETPWIAVLSDNDTTATLVPLSRLAEGE